MRPPRRLSGALTARLRRRRRSLLLDFSNTGYINSTGIALIVGLLARARANGVELSARGLSDHYREIFEITRLSDYIRIIEGGGNG